MNMTKETLLLGALLLITQCPTAVAQSVPPLVNYQGQLLDPSGVPIPTGDYDVEVRLFPVESGGVALWGPQRFNGQNGVGLGSKVAVVQGRFNVVLGPKDINSADLAQVFAKNASVFIELKVGVANPIAPRQQMLAAPFALHALTAAGLKGDQILADGRLGVGALPTAGYPLEVSGAGFFNTGGSGGSLLIHTPSAETGITMGRVNRADIRFDDSTLKFLSGGGRLPSGIDHGMAIALSGNVGIGTITPNFKLEVVGSAGKPGGGSWSNTSDARLKKNIQPLSGALDKLLALRGVNFEYIDPAAIHELAGERTGLIAQEVEKVMPDWVETGADGYKRVTVRGLEALVVEALRDLRQEQEDQVAKLRKEKELEIEELRRSVAELKALISPRPAQANGGGR